MTAMLLTGATSGIGLALCQLALQYGYQVIACGRNPEPLQPLSDTYPTTLMIKLFDVTDARACQASLRDVQADIYVLNAGLCEYIDASKLEPALFKRVFEANVLGTVNVMAALNLQAGNQVVVVDSLARLLPFSRAAAYGASKAALHYMTHSMQTDLAEQGVLMQSASPGFVHTPMTAQNTFTMPMAISTQHAAKALLKGIQTKKRQIYFPRRFSAILRLLARLPLAWQLALSQHLRKGASQ